MRTHKLQLNLVLPEESEQLWELYERHPILKVWDQAVMKKLADRIYKESGYRLAEDVGAHVRHDIGARPIPEYTCFEITVGPETVV